MKIVVIGGAGLIGTKVVKNLRGKGHEVVVAAPSKGINSVTGDGLAAAPAPLSAKLLKNGLLKTYKGFPHGMPATEAKTINTDLLAFIKAPH